MKNSKNLGAKWRKNDRFDDYEPTGEVLVEIKNADDCIYRVVSVEDRELIDTGSGKVYVDHDWNDVTRYLRIEDMN
jgi:hypothetical protein